MATECRSELVLERCDVAGSSITRSRTFSEKSDDFGDFCDDTTDKDYFELSNPFEALRKDSQTLERCFCRLNPPPQNLAETASLTPCQASVESNK